MHEAAFRKNLPAVRALLEAGAEVNARTAEDDTPLHRVMASRNSPGTLLTIPHDAPPQLRNAGGPDDLAAFDLDTAVAAALVRAGVSLEAGARVNVRILGGQTPLQVLVSHIRWWRDLAPAAIAAMLKAGADVNAGTGSGWTALHGAVGDRWTHVPEDPVPSADAGGILSTGCQGRGSRIGSTVPSVDGRSYK